MKTFLLFMMVILATACGSGKGGGTNSSIKSEPVKGELSSDERELVQKLIEVKSLPQKDLMKEFLKLETLSKETFKKFDAYLIINCSQSDGLCELTQKEEL